MRQAVPERKAATPQRLRGACAGASSAPARAASGLRPGILRSPARSWLTWMCGPWPLRTLASGMGQIPGPGFKGATLHPRNARPDAVNLLPIVSVKARHGTSGQSPRWSAGRRAGPRSWAGDLRPNFRRSARPRGGPPGASVNRASAVQRSIPLTFSGGNGQGAARAPLQAGGGALPAPCRSIFTPAKRKAPDDCPGPSLCSGVCAQNRKFTPTRNRCRLVETVWFAGWAAAAPTGTKIVPRLRVV